MKHLYFYSLIIALLSVLPVSAQTRSARLTIAVTASTGESLAGQQLKLEQTDYSLSYQQSETTLDSEGKCSLKVYPGNHRVSIERDGFISLSQEFNVSDDMTLNLQISEDVRDPFALKTSVSHNALTGKNNITLSWNKEDPVFFDNFESYDGWTVNFAPWTGIDGDLAAAAPLEGSYPNRGTLQYAQIINPLTVEPAWWYDYPVLQSYSGQQYVGFIRTSSGAANDDWLISPAVTVAKGNCVSFMAKAADVYKERFEVGVTTVDNPDKDDFTIISPGNYQTVGYEQWQRMEYDLSAYEGETVKIAIHYISSANNGGAFMLMVDDFFVGQPGYFDDETASTALAKSLRVAEPRAAAGVKYEVYLNGEKYGETSAKSYEFTKLAAGTYTLGVKAVYTSAQSNTSQTTVSINDDDYAHVTFNVSANDGTDANGVNIDLINTATSEQLNLRAWDGKADIISLPKGSYILNIESANYNKYSETITVSADMTHDIHLTEAIIDPYNITDTQSDNAASPSLVDVTVKWNQNLGFTDSFENYDDFASGSFGGWTTIDNDKKTCYPIGLGSTSNIVTFPGASTPDAPAAVLPMVFNPYKTVPAMAPSDAAVIASDGDKSVIFFSPQMSTADKWLIAPAQNVYDGYKLSFAAKAYSSVYVEKFEICISTTDDAVSSFSVIDTVTPTSDYWTTYSVNLDKYEGQTVYIALHYISTDAFFAQVDNVYIGPETASEAKVGKVLHYDVQLDGVAQPTTEKPQYSFIGLSRGEHTVGIRAVYTSGKSNLVTYTFNAMGGVTDISADSTAVIGGNGEIRFIGGTGIAQIYDIAGRSVATLTLGNTATAALPQGVYIVRTAQSVRKVFVK